MAYNFDLDAFLQTHDNALRIHLISSVEPPFHDRLMEAVNLFASSIQDEARAQALKEAAEIAPEKKFWSQTDPNGRETLYAKGYNQALDDFAAAIERAVSEREHIVDQRVPFISNPPLTEDEIRRGNQIAERATVAQKEVPTETAKRHRAGSTTGATPSTSGVASEPVWKRQESCPECDGDGCAFCEPVCPMCSKPVIVDIPGELAQARQQIEELRRELTILREIAASSSGDKLFAEQQLATLRADNDFIRKAVKTAETGLISPRQQLAAAEAAIQLAHDGCLAVASVRGDMAVHLESIINSLRQPTDALRDFVLRLLPKRPELRGIHDSCLDEIRTNLEKALGGS